jgi:hypothetical protein
MTRTDKRRNNRGQCLIETVIGCMVMVPIALVGLDVTTMVVSYGLNKNLVKNAARAAANQDNPELAKKAAKAIIDGMKKSEIISQITMDTCKYSGEHVSVRTSVFVKLPAPFPFMTKVTMAAEATEPIVGVPADQEAT